MIEECFRQVRVFYQLSGGDSLISNAGKAERSTGRSNLLVGNMDEPCGKLSLANVPMYNGLST